MASFFDFFLPDRSRRVRPTQTVGAPGVAIDGGYIRSNERDARLVGRQKYLTYSEYLANVSILAAGTRYFLNLAAQGEWSFKPSEADRDGRFAEMAEKIITVDPNTSWARIIRRQAMYRFMGFSIAEKTAFRRDDGVLSILDVAPRGQLTIERWDQDKTSGDILGVVQRRPQDQRDVYLPRQKLLYTVDDSIYDSPEGLGLIRHIVKACDALQRYEQLEGFGFETNLRGIPVARAPIGTMQEQGADDAKIASMTQSIRAFVSNPIKTLKNGLILPSETFQTTDEKSTPSAQRMWDVELLNGNATGQAEIQATINRLNLEIARVLGVEGLLLGGQGGGSESLSRDKSRNLYLIVDSTRQEMADSIQRDLVDWVWMINGWDAEMKPTVVPEQIKFTTVEEQASALRNIAQAGAPIMREDEAVKELFNNIGLTPPETEQELIL